MSTRGLSQAVPVYQVGPREGGEGGGEETDLSEAIHYYVAPNGNDGWGGQLATPHPGRTDGPFATLERARNAIRTTSYSQPIVVNIREGIYFLEEPFELHPVDSGRNGMPIVYRAYNNERVVISGGRRITADWQTFIEPHIGRSGRVEPRPRPFFFAELPPLENDERWEFNSLFVDGVRAIRARSPNQGDRFPYFEMAQVLVYGDRTYWTDREHWCHVAPNGTWCSKKIPNIPERDYSSFVFQGFNIQGTWQNLREVEVVALRTWEQTRQRIDRVEGDRVTLQAPNFRPYAFMPWHGRYYVENLFEALDSPGEWYLDRQNSRLYYWPLPGQEIDRLELIVPRLRQLVKLHPGTHDVTFQGLHFAHTDWILPYHDEGGEDPEYYYEGHVGCLAATCSATPPTIEFVGAERIRFLGNRISQTGGYALGGPMSQSIIRGNLIFDTGGGGVRIGGTETGEHTLDSVGRPIGYLTGSFLSRLNDVTDNTIRDIGKVYLESVGIQAILNQQTRIAYNVVTNGPYTGIMAVTGFWHFQATRAERNLIEHNEVHHVGQVLTDLGGIYLAGRQPGTIVRRNLVHDIVFTPHHLHRLWLNGIYLDQGSLDNRVTENIVSKTGGASFAINEGAFNIVVNNLFADGQFNAEENNVQGQLMFSCREDVRDARLRDYAPRGYAKAVEELRDRPRNNLFERNIIFYTQPRERTISYADWPFPFIQSNHNLFFSRASPTSPGNLAAWRRDSRQDLASLVADPRLGDFARGEFRLRPNSPAPEIGFRPFALSP